LCDKHDDRNGRFVARNTDTNVCVVGVHQDLPFFVHFQEQIASLDKEILSVGGAYLYIFLVVGDELTCTKLDVISDLLR
jgi:hypothetical protein